MTYWQWLLVFFGAQAVWSFLVGCSRRLAGFHRCSLCRVWRRNTRRLLLDVQFKETTKANLDWVICPHCLHRSFAESMRQLAEGLIAATDAVERSAPGEAK